MTLKPIINAGLAVGAQRSLLDLTPGSKRVLSYFHTRNGQRKLTIMVADALNGEDVLNSATVRFEAAIGAGTAAGRSLEFACVGGGKEMSVRADPPKPDYASGT